MYSRIFKRTIRTSTSSPFKNSSPYGGLLAACLFGLFGAKVVKNKLEENKSSGYGCYERPKKFISYNPSSKIDDVDIKK